jgi:hypothetical protein
MMKTSLCCAISMLLLLLTVLVTPVRAQQGNPPTVEKIKIDVNKLGTGEKTKAKITLKNATKVKGYVSEAGEQSFVLRDRKTDAPTTIAYADVMKVEKSRSLDCTKHCHRRWHWSRSISSNNCHHAGPP